MPALHDVFSEQRHRMVKLDEEPPHPIVIPTPSF
jgi:hypothetical protein